VDEWFRVAPMTPNECAYPEKGFCQPYPVKDYAYYKRVAFWATPIASCGNGQNNCVDYSKWTQAWTDVKG
jgi:putative spermidine/putrescine transport system substrate-binding protein